LSHMTVAPRCTGLGRHCRALSVTLSIGNLGEDDAHARDALATWLLGHRERISFGVPYRRGRDVVVDAVIHVPCKYLRAAGAADAATGAGAAVRCAAHGFAGDLPVARRAPPAPLQHADGSLTLVHQERPRRMTLDRRPAPPRALPVLAMTNPCLEAPCRTADHTRGAACCRDLTLEIVAPQDDRRSHHLDALLRARRSPYLCKTERASPRIIECEVISACGYLEGDGISCALHHRVRPDGTPAKPEVCSAWPDLGPDDVGHPGCRLVAEKGEKAHKAEKTRETRGGAAAAAASAPSAPSALSAPSAGGGWNGAAAGWAARRGGP
jgi:hypothetical protein